MTREAHIGAVLTETQALVAAMPMLNDFVCDALEGLQRQDLPPRHRNAVDLLQQNAGLPTCALTAPLVHAIKAAANDLHWSLSYTEAQVSAHFLEHSGWFNLVSPEGPYLHQDIRVSIGYWHNGLHYPDHRHEPEEIYCVLAGGATFRTENRPPVDAKPGDLIHHPPNIRHSADMTDSALLAIAFWKGANLLRPSDLNT